MTALAPTAGSAVRRYEAILDVLRPGCVDEDRRLRCGILYLRDRATAALQVAGWEAAGVLRHVEALGCVHGVGTMPAAELNELHRAMVRLMGVAMALDMRGPRTRGMG